MWYLTFIWATLGITSSFILQSVTLQWSFPGLQSCPGPLADILAPYARAAPGPGQRQHINNAPQCEFDLVFLLCGAYSPFLGREKMTLVCPQTTFPALPETTTAHPELTIHCSIMGLSQCFALLQSPLLYFSSREVSVPVSTSICSTAPSMYTIHSSLTSLLTGECHGLCVPSRVNLCQMETVQAQLILAGSLKTEWAHGLAAGVGHMGSTCRTSNCRCNSFLPLDFPSLLNLLVTPPFFCLSNWK